MKLEVYDLIEKRLIISACLRILRNLSEQLFYKTHPGSCSWTFIKSTKVPQKRMPEVSTDNTEIGIVNSF